MKKNGIKIALISLLGFAVLAFAGCEKTTVQGGADTNYPYSYSIASNGTVTVKLNGKASPDYKWTAVSDDESIITVKNKGRERGGKATFKIKPVSEGTASVTFTREKETAVITQIGDFVTSEELAAYEAEIASEPKPSQVGPDDPITDVPDLEDASEIPSEDADDENTVPIPESPRTEETARIPKDRVCSIRILFTVTTDGKKYQTTAEVLMEGETAPIISEADQGLPYQIWPDEYGTYRVNLPSVPGGWLITYDTEYTGVKEEALDPETGEAIGYYENEPLMDEDGNPVIIDAYTLGGVYDESFKITPYAQGNGTLYFSAPNDKKRLEIHFTIGNTGELTIESHSMVDYEPSKAELDQVKVEPK